MLNPSGWAFAIWAPIYLGETAFVASQLLAPAGSALANVLPQITAPFVAFNLAQSLWCASFRPSYHEGWHKWISVAMLGGTAYSLSFIHSVALSNPELAWWYFLPMTMHFGWTTAATLVNLNRSFAMQTSVNNTAIVGLGHASAVAASALGVALGLNSTAYGLTVAWALAACSDGMAKRLNETPAPQNQDETLITGARVQRALCAVGSIACIGASVIALL